MDREDAINYLEGKGRLRKPYDRKERKFSKEEEDRIIRVEKEGKIYGDPVVEILK